MRTIRNYRHPFCDAWCEGHHLAPAGRPSTRPTRGLQSKSGTIGTLKSYEQIARTIQRHGPTSRYADRGALYTECRNYSDQALPLVELSETRPPSHLRLRRTGTRRVCSFGRQPHDSHPAHPATKVEGRVTRTSGEIDPKTHSPGRN